MLTQMRALSQNIFGRAILAVILILIIASFAIWGINDRFTGYDANVIARIGSAKITTEQYQTAYRIELARLEQQQKRHILNEEARRLGVDREVMSRLQTDVLLEQQADRLGLAVGNDEITRVIMTEDTFKGPSGQFDHTLFDRLLRDNGYTETTYANVQRKLILRQDVSNAIVGALQVPAILKDAVHRFQAEVRDADFFILPPEAVGKIAGPSEAEAKAYYDDHAASYMAPEYRKLTVLSVVPASLVKPDAVTEDEARKRYEDQKAARFAQPERRTVEQLVFPDAAAAQVAADKIKGGEAFDKLVAEAKKTSADVALGTVAKADLADTAVADATFGLSENGTSGPVKSQFGVVLLHVSKITPAQTQPLIEVDAQLKDEIAILKAKQQTQQAAEKVEDARGAGKPLSEAAAAAGLTVRTLDAIDAQGRDRAGRPVEGLVDGPQLLKTAFSTDPGADTEMLRSGDGGNEWYEGVKIDPAHKRPFAELKTTVENAWRSEETMRRLAAEGDKIVKAIDGGKTIAAAAAEAKQTLEQARNVGRAGAPQLPSPEASAFFEQPTGKAGSVAAQGRGRLIFSVIAARVPPVDPGDTAFQKLMTQVQSGFEGDVTETYLGRLRSELGSTFNRKALDSVMGGEPGS